MVIQYKYFKESNILVQRYSGDSNKDLIIDFLSKLASEEEYLKVRYIVSDFRDVKVLLSEEDVAYIVNRIVDHSPKQNSVFNAILVQEPLQTAFTYLFRMAMQGFTWYDCIVVCSNAVAASYVGLTERELTNIFNDTEYITI